MTRSLVLAIGLTLGGVALAHPADVRDSDDVGGWSASLRDDGAWVEVYDVADLAGAYELVEQHDELLEAASGRRDALAIAVRVAARLPDGVEIALVDLLPEPEPVPDKYDGWRSQPASYPGRADGFLSGKAAYMSQCHGWQWYSSLGRFSTQRGILWETVEDFHNPEAHNQFLVAYVENAGMAVYTAKERDLQTRMAIADNDGAGYTETGAGFTNGAAGFAARTTYTLGTNPFSLGTTRSFPADGGGVARWQPTVPAPGHYAVYVSWKSNSGHASDAHYRITHPGGQFDRYFDQRVHGSTWQYVDTLWLGDPQSLTVELIGDSNQAGKLLSADAVRIGGGVGDVVRNGATTGRPRWEEAALLHTQFNGAPQSVYHSAGDASSDPSARSRWASWEKPSGEDAVFVSWHSNAASGTARGTVTYHTGSECSASAVSGSSNLARLLNIEIVSQLRAGWDPNWQDRATNTACFGELNPAYNNKMPAALVELAFHDNETDNAFLREPVFRRDAARGMYRGLVRYFAERDGVTPRYLPEPPTHVAAVHDSTGRIRVSWRSGPTGAPNGDAAQSYIVQTSRDGRAWDEGFAVTGTTTLVDAPLAQLYYRVIGVNDGGHSFPSEVVGARRSPERQAPVLVVGAFDRLDVGQLELVSASPIGSVRRMNLRRMNSFDIIARHGRAISAAGWFFDSATDEAFADLDLSDYRVVVWGAGEESVVDETISTAQQQKLRAFVEGGGALWVSGSELLWDLDARGSASDKAFAREVLGATLDKDTAGSQQGTGEGLLAGVAFSFTVADGAPYPVEFPDSLTSSRPVIARYQSGEIAAVLGERVATFGFPFDAVASPTAAASIAERVLTELVPDLEPPVPDDTGIPVGPIDPIDPGNPNTLQSGRVRLGQAGCGCAAPVGAGSWLGLTLLVPLLVRRRNGRR